MILDVLQNSAHLNLPLELQIVQNGENLSSGQRQLVCLARAVLKILKGQSSSFVSSVVLNSTCFSLVSSVVLNSTCFSLVTSVV